MSKIGKVVKTNGSNGFTLIELIVVIAILGVLIAILVPSMMGFMDNAKMVSVKAEAKTILDGGQALAGQKVLIDGAAINANAISIENMADAHFLDAGIVGKGQLTDMAIGADGVTITHFVWTHDGYQVVYDSGSSPQWLVQKVDGGAGDAGDAGGPGGGKVDNPNKGPGNNNGNDDAPGQNKDPNEPADGKGQNKNP